MVKRFGGWVFLLLILSMASAQTLACVGARPLAMGGAFIAVADDANAVYWNPAGLTQISDEYESTYMTTVEGNINYQWFFSGVERRGNVVYGGSSINSILMLQDQDGMPVAIFDNTWYQVSLGIPLDDRLSVGANVKFYEAQLYDGQTSSSGQGVGMDIAVHYQATDRLRLGLLSQDIFGSDIHFSEGTVAMASNVRPGIAYEVNEDTTVAADIYDLTGDTYYSIGLEERFSAGALRAGFYHDTWTAGFGLNGGSDISLDYCYIYDSHILSLSWAF